VNAETIDREKEFYDVLRNYLARSSSGKEFTVQVIYDGQGQIDPVRTMNLPCYAGLKEEVEKGITDFFDGLREVLTK
jgi:hypothetical protein